MARARSKPITAIIIGHLIDPVLGAKAESARDAFVCTLPTSKSSSVVTHHHLESINQKTKAKLHLRITNNLLQDAITLQQLELSEQKALLTKHDFGIVCANTEKELELLLKPLVPHVKKSVLPKIIIVAGTALFKVPRERSYFYKDYPILSVESPHLHKTLCELTTLFHKVKYSGFSIFNETKPEGAATQPASGAAATSKPPMAQNFSPLQHHK